MQLFSINFILLVLIALIAGCSTAQDNGETGDQGTPSQVQQLLRSRDEFAGLTVRGMTWSKLDGNTADGGLTLYLMRMNDGGLNMRYCLAVEFRGTDWLFIPVGPTLTLDLGGSTIILSGYGSNENRKILDEEVIEMAYYAVTTEQLKALAAARSIAVTVHTARRSLPKDGLEKIRGFVSKYIGP